MIEALEGVFAVILIRIGHDGVFAVDDHGVDSFSTDVEGTDFGDAAFAIDLGLVGFGKLFGAGGVVAGLEAGKVVGHGPAVAGALDIVLPAHGVDAAALDAEVAGHEGEVAERFDVVDAADVLGDSQRVEDRAGVAFSKDDTGQLDVVGGDFADARGPLGGEFFDVFEEFSGSGSACLDEALVEQSFALDDVSHGEEKGDVGPDPDGQVEVGQFRELGLSWVGHDHFRPVGDGFFQPRRSDGVALGHVRPDGENDVRLLHIRKRIAHCTSTDCSCQTGNCGSVSRSRTVIYIIGPERCPDEFLHRVGGLVGRSPGGDSVDRMSSEFVADLGEAGGGEVEGFVPFAFVEFAVVAPDERLFETVGVLDKVEGELAFDTEGTFVGGAVHGRLDADDLVAFAEKVDTATDAAVGADAACFFDLAGCVGIAESFFIAERAGGAGLDALAAEGAVGVAKVDVVAGDDLGAEPAAHHADSVVTLLLGADADAAVAGNAVVVIAEDEGVFVVGVGGAGLFPGEATGTGVVAVDENGEFLRGVTAQLVDIDVAIFRSDEFEKGLAVFLDCLGLRFYDHAFGCFGRARGDGEAGTFQLDDAESAGAESVKAFVVAECGNFLAMAFSYFVNRLAFGKFDLLTIESEHESLLGKCGVEIGNHGGGER